MILLRNISILAKHTMYRAPLYSFWKNLSGHFDRFACNTRKISILLSRTRYGKINGVRSTTSSFVFDTRPGLPIPGCSLNKETIIFGSLHFLLSSPGFVLGDAILCRCQIQNSSFKPDNLHHNGGWLSSSVPQVSIHAMTVSLSTN